MLKLITFPGGFDEPSHSPFCVKAMIQLEMAGVSWEPEYTGKTSAGPLGRLPALRTPAGVIPETGFIQRYLESQGADFYGDISTAKRAHGHSLIRMIEEHLRLGVAHDRWLHDGCWTKMMPAIFSGVPAPLRPAISTMARRSVRAGLKSQGLARMSEDQRVQCFARDLECLTDLLWDSPFLLGDKPTAVDTAAVPVLSMLAGLPADTLLRREVRANATLMAYIERGRDALYPDLSRYAVAA